MQAFADFIFLGHFFEEFGIDDGKTALEMFANLRSDGLYEFIPGGVAVVFGGDGDGHVV